MATQDLRGKLVCFTGSLENYTFRGEPLTRGLAERIAVEAGLGVWPSVTKKVEILVVADPNTLSTKAKKARDYGARIMAASAFFAAIGVSIEQEEPSAAGPPGRWSDASEMAVSRSPRVASHLRSYDARRRRPPAHSISE